MVHLVCFLLIFRQMSTECFYLFFKLLLIDFLYIIYYLIYNISGDGMKSIFMNNTMAFLKKYNNYSEKDLEKLEYGLEGIYLTITKLVVLSICAVLLGITKQFIALLILFNIIRYTGFGFHAEKSWQCLICSSIGFILIPLFFTRVELAKSAYAIIDLICIISYLLFAPADTIKRPLPNKKKRIIRKTITVIVGIIYSVLNIVFFEHWISSILISSLVIQAIVINPLIYVLFGQPYNNYKNYNSD